MLVFVRGRKTGEGGELLEQVRTNSQLKPYMARTGPESNPDHIGGEGGGECSHHGAILV